MCNYYTMTTTFPTSQGELLAAARGAATQAEFAKQLGVDRTCLSRYEREQLGAPTAVLNYCLKVVADRLSDIEGASMIDQALAHVRRAAIALEHASKNGAQTTSRSRTRRQSRA
jgi:hypothetical protein